MCTKAVDNGEKLIVPILIKRYETDIKLNLVEVCYGNGRWMKWLWIMSGGGLLVLANYAKTDITWHVMTLFITWPQTHASACCCALLVFVFVYCESIIAGRLYRYKVDHMIDIMPSYSTEYPSPDSMFCRLQ